MADKQKTEDALYANDPRNKKPSYDLARVDFEWVASATDKRELLKAYEALKEDNGFPDL